MKKSIPKQLWQARLEFRQPGRWAATEVFYLDKPYFPDVAKPMKCHVLYETPMEAYLALHKEICAELRKFKGSTIKIHIYSVRLDLITNGNYHGPDKIKEKGLFTYDGDLITRHLVRQSLTFLRAGTLSVSYNRFEKKEITDFFFTDSLGREKFLMPLRQPVVETTFGLWSKYQCAAVTNGVFNFIDFPFVCETALKIHNPKNLELTKHEDERSLATTE